ncbi:hypothetical protein D3C74_427740 [compost metagenome]
MRHYRTSIRVADDFEDPFIGCCFPVPGFVCYEGTGPGVHLIADKIAFPVHQHDSGNLRAECSEALKKFADVIFRRLSASGPFDSLHRILDGAVQKGLHPWIKRD